MDDQFKRGPGRPRLNTVSLETIQEPGELVTYLPNDGDPTKTKWRGIEFHANIPVRITDESHIASARGNPSFRVGNDGPTENPNHPPRNAMEYRGHVLKWVKDLDQVEHVVQHWAKDRILRAALEVGEDDIQFLGTIIEPKLSALRKAQGLSQHDVASLWIKYGVLELPWRA